MTKALSSSLETPAEAAPPPSPLASSIVCGTDFSETSTEAVDVAAMFARRTNEPLVLVHAVNEPSHRSLPGEVRDSLALYARAQYHDQCEHLRALDIHSVEAFHFGSPDAALIQEAANHRARLLVMASAKKSRVSRWLLGSVAERVAETARTPTLIVRDAAPLLRWGQNERRLRVVIGADLTATSEVAMRWVDWLRQTGPCDIVVAYFDPEPIALPIVESYPVPLVDDLILETIRKQERFFRQRVRELLGRSNVRVRFEKGWGFSDAHLIQLAGDERADLIVVGTHSRRGWRRLGHHSVSRGIIHYAPFNVVCVPQAGGAVKSPSRDPSMTSEPSAP